MLQKLCMSRSHAFQKRSLPLLPALCITPSQPVPARVCQGSLLPSAQGHSEGHSHTGAGPFFLYLHSELANAEIMTAVYRVGLVWGRGREGVKYNHLNGCIALLVSKHGRKEVPPHDVLYSLHPMTQLPPPHDSTPSTS